MQRLAAGVSYVDLRFLDIPRAIASVILQGSSGVAIVDPGPSTTLSTLAAALQAASISVRDVTAVLLTHIHLDHAGATGTLAAENPALRVFVHEKGAPHLASPDKLVASAARLYGADMDRLWGEVRAVPPSAIVSLRGGERIGAGGRTWEVAYTPGHASHHVSYFNRDLGLAFVGDVAGVAVVAGGPILPPTPPPDIDVELWYESASQIERWAPDTLFLTHFGPMGRHQSHLAELRDQLARTAALVKESLARNSDDHEREEWFVEQMRIALRRRLAEPEARATELVARFDLSWRGLARYWRKRG